MATTAPKWKPSSTFTNPPSVSLERKIYDPATFRQKDQQEKQPALAQALDHPPLGQAWRQGHSCSDSEASLHFYRSRLGTAEPNERVAIQRNQPNPFCKGSRLMLLHQQASDEKESERLRLVRIMNKQRRLPIQLSRARNKVQQLEKQAAQIGLRHLVENKDALR
jgi:hypothetical protein